MSKVVKRVGNFVKKVVKGAVKVVKKVWDNPIGRIVIIAVASMVLTPMVGALANGASFSAAWAAGVGNLTSTLTGVGSSLMAGEFAQAGSTLMAGIGGSNVPAELAFDANLGAGYMANVADAGAATTAFGTDEALQVASNSVTGTMTDAGANLMPEVIEEGASQGITEKLASEGGKKVVESAATTAPTTGAEQTLEGFVKKPIWDSAASEAATSKFMWDPFSGASSPVAGMKSTVAPDAGASWFAKMMGSKYAAPAAINLAGNMISSVGSGMQQEAMLDEQERQYNRELARRNLNQSVGSVALPGR